MYNYVLWSCVYEDRGRRCCRQQKENAGNENKILCGKLERKRDNWKTYVKMGG